MKREGKKEGAASALIRPAAVLLAICAIVSAALALTYAATKDAIEQSARKEADALRSEVMPGAQFEQVDLPGADMGVGAGASAGVDTGVGAGAGAGARVLEMYKATAQDGALAGYVATASAKGYNGDVAVIVGVRADGSISGARVSSHAETPGLGSNAAKPEFYGQYGGGRAEEPFAVVNRPAGASNEISAVSGATITSKAVTDAVNAAASAIHAQLKEGGT